jgi:hypothetical protein
LRIERFTWLSQEGILAIYLGEQKLLWFWYESRDLSEIPVEDFRKRNLDGLTALMLFCKGGNTYEVLEEILTRLKERRDLIALVRQFAGKVFTSEEDKKRLRRRFAMLQDFLRDSWIYQEDREEALQEGRAEGFEKGRALLRQTITDAVQARFPTLLPLAESKIALLLDMEQLQQISFKVGTIRTARELKKYLLALE